MNTESNDPVSAPPSVQTFWQRAFKWPVTRLGWWSVGLGAVFLILMIINSTVFMRLTGNAPWQSTLLPFYGIFMLLFGLGAGVVGLMAVIRKQEHSLLAWLAMLPALFVLLLLLGEFLVPH